MITLTRKQLTDLSDWLGEMSDKSETCGKKDTSRKLDLIRRVLEDVAIHFGTAEKRFVSIKEELPDPEITAVTERMKRYEGTVDLDRTEICPYSKEGKYCSPCKVNNGCFVVEGSREIFQCITVAACNFGKQQRRR